jgi:hypothetical protein
MQSLLYHNSMSLLNATVANVGVQTGNKQVGFRLFTAAKGTF